MRGYAWLVFAGASSGLGSALSPLSSPHIDLTSMCGREGTNQTFVPPSFSFGNRGRYEDLDKIISQKDISPDVHYHLSYGEDSGVGVNQLTSLDGDIEQPMIFMTNLQFIQGLYIIVYYYLGCRHLQVPDKMDVFVNNLKYAVKFIFDAFGRAFWFNNIFRFIFGVQLETKYMSDWVYYLSMIYLLCIDPVHRAFLQAMYTFVQSMYRYIRRIIIRTYNSIPLWLVIICRITYWGLYFWFTCYLSHYSSYYFVNYLIQKKVWLVVDDHGNSDERAYMTYKFLFHLDIARCIVTIVFHLPQISGSHGEWTESDDVSMVDSILDRLFRRPRAVPHDVDYALNQARVIPVEAFVVPPVIVQQGAAEQEVIPLCRNFARGNCTRRNCRFRHDLPANDVPGEPHIPVVGPPDGGDRGEDIYEISQQTVFVNRPGSSMFDIGSAWFYYFLSIFRFITEAFFLFFLVGLGYFYFDTEIFVFVIILLVSIIKKIFGRAVVLRDQCVLSYRVISTLRPFVPRDVMFGDPVYENNTKISCMAHYLGYYAMRRVAIYPRIASKMFSRVGGSLSGQTTLLPNLLGWGMREYPEGEYNIMFNTATTVFQQVLAAKDRARYAMPTNVGVNATVSTTLA